MKKKTNTLINKIFNRLTFVILFMLLQIAVVVVMVQYFQEHFALFYIVCEVLSIVIVIRIISQSANPAYKIAWIIPILALPVFGNLLYLLGRQFQTREQKRRTAYVKAKTAAAMGYLPGAALEEDDPGCCDSRYIRRASAAPPRRRTETEYLPLGDVMFPRMLEEIDKARRYIFLEYFILERGYMLDTLLEALYEKARQGVEVFLIYDDMGSIRRVPDDLPRILGERGIKCRVFHRFKPVLTGSFNTRDHRKILVVDGLVAFTGGINIADEYINRIERFGHWQDSGVMIRGEGAWSFAVMFLSMWDSLTGGDADYRAYLPDPAAISVIPSDGVVQPYSDEPLDQEPVGENAYIGVITRARRYVYIETPYLVIDNELCTALCTAAKSGVDVRIMTPGIPDKAYVYTVTRSYYRILIEAGVRIFEYTPGFLHSKTCVADDQLAICGTINFDYRSLYLHHECAVFMSGSSAVSAMKRSFDGLLPKCREITEQWVRDTPWYKRIIQSLLRVFSPLM